MYDYIFFDAPPASVVTDATVLAQKLDGVVFIVRQNRTEYSDIRKIIDDIERLDGTVLGTIITDASNLSSIGLSRYKAYDYHYGGVSIKTAEEKKNARQAAAKAAPPKAAPPKAAPPTDADKK